MLIADFDECELFCALGLIPLEFSLNDIT